MKCKVFGVPREPEVLFKLVECYETVKLVTCDSEGKMLPDSNILSIQRDGTLYLFRDVNPSLGLKLDEDGRITLNND